MLKPPPSMWCQRHRKTHKAFQVSVCINRLSKQSYLIGKYGAHAAIKYSVQHRSHSSLEGIYRSPIYHNWRLELIAWSFLQIPCQKPSSTDMSYPEVKLKKNLESWFPASNHTTNLFKVSLYHKNSLKPSAACTKILIIERACTSRTPLLPEKASLKNRKLFLGLTNKLNLRLWKSFSQVPPCRQRNNSTLNKYEGLRKHAEHPNAVCEVLAYPN